MEMKKSTHKAVALTQQEYVTTLTKGNAPARWKRDGVVVEQGCSQTASFNSIYVSHVL